MVFNDAGNAANRCRHDRPPAHYPNFQYLLTGRRLYGVVRRLKYALYACASAAFVSAPVCKQIQENLHRLIEKLKYSAPKDLRGTASTKNKG